MKRLGQILLEQGWVTPEHLLRALNHQKLVGGRLGTCLLEMEAVDERLLLRALSLQLGVPAADIDDLRGIPDEVIDLFPAKVARRCHAVPFRLLGGQLSVALLAIRDLAIQDELAFVSGKRLRIHIANEARVFEALEKYYGEECPQRFSQLLDRINRARYLWDRPAREETRSDSPQAESHWEFPPPKTPNLDSKPARTPAPVSPEKEKIANAEPPGRPLATSAPTPSPPSSIAPAASPSGLASEKPAPIPAPMAAAGAAAETPSPPASPTAPVITISLTEAEERLAKASDRDEVGRAVLDFLRGRFRRALLFGLRQEEITGWMAAASDVDGERFRQLRLSLGAPSIFSTLRKGGAGYRGALSPLPAHRQVADLWGGVLPPEVIVLPVSVRGRQAAQIYLDGALPTVATELTELQHLATLAGAALEACIQKKKLAGGGSVDAGASVH